MKCPIHPVPKCVKGKPYDIKQHCRWCWNCIHDWRFRDSKFQPLNGTAKHPCLHLGKEIDGPTRMRLNLAHSKTWRDCKMGFGPQCNCNAKCGPACVGYSPDMSDAEEEIKPVRPASSVKWSGDVMISIGSYGMPGIVELQAAAIRANCGDIPILVSDDHTEQAGDDGYEKKARLLDICDKYDLQFRDAAPERVGHSGGDLGAFWHGLHYAAGKDIPYVLKLSQRLIIDRPNYAQRCVDILRNREGHTMSQTHKNRGRFFFAMRTEFVLMSTHKWMRADFMETLKPRPIGRAAEDVVHSCVRRMGGAVIACPLITPERSKAHAGVVWYEQPNSNDAYSLLAYKYGVELGPGYHNTSSIFSPNFKWG